jgi:FemAB-related protein (PEP-CTERM system-associated)
MSMKQGGFVISTSPIMQNMKITVGEMSDNEKWDSYVISHPSSTHCHLSCWKDIVESSYGHKAYYLTAKQDSQIVGVLPLFHLKSRFFGNELVSIPYFSGGGVVADSDEIGAALVAEALDISRDLDTGHIELRQFQSLEDSLSGHYFTRLQNDKVRLLLELPGSSEILFRTFKAKLRSQIRRPGKEGMVFHMGGVDMLPHFYNVFSYNMRDLGSPVHSMCFFQNICRAFGDRVKIGVVFHQETPVASGLIIIDKNYAVIPWASSLRAYNRFGPNMLLYWSFLAYACDDSLQYFDFERSTVDKGTYRFKKQWGSSAEPLYWYRIYREKHETHAESFNGDSPMKNAFISIWRHIPIPIANVIGPKIRGSISL